MDALTAVIVDDDTLARDRLGVKPLYLSRNGERLRFASTLPALLKGGDIDPMLDPVALNHYLNFHAVVPAPRTLLANVRRPEWLEPPLMPARWYSLVTWACKESHAR